MGGTRRRKWTFAGVENFWQDVMYAARMGCKNPGFPLTSVLIQINPQPHCDSTVSEKPNPDRGVDQNQQATLRFTRGFSQRRGTS